MHYTEQEGYGPLPFDPFKAIVAPRPIGWISTLDTAGRANLAPYSFFNAVSSRPNMVGFSSDGLKHSPRNCRDTGEFVANLSTRALLAEMNDTSQEVADGVDEFALAGLETAPSRMVGPPRVAASPAALECVVVSCDELQDRHGRPTDRWWVVGEVVAVYIDDAYLRDGQFDTARAAPLGRCGYRDYASADVLFELLRPTDPGRVIR